MVMVMSISMNVRALTSANPQPPKAFDMAFDLNEDGVINILDTA